MSSTNRSKARDKHIADYYVTPVKEVENFMREFTKIDPIFYDSNIRILDPCGGGDTLHPMSYPQAFSNVGVETHKVTTIDIREDSLADIKADYLELKLDYEPNVIITNPPFFLAKEIILKALDDVVDGGYVIMLLRLNFLGSDSRKSLWDAQLPKYIIVHHKRMSFRDDGKTDSIEYAHFVWQKGHYPEFSQLKVI